MIPPCILYSIYFCLTCVIFVLWFYADFEKPITHKFPSQCFNRWFDLGILLDIPIQKLREIKFSDNNDKPDACCMKMFTEWLNDDDNPTCTWAALSNAATSILSCDDHNLSNYSSQGLILCVIKTIISYRKKWCISCTLIFSEIYFMEISTMVIPWFEQGTITSTYFK